MMIFTVQMKSLVLIQWLSNRLFSYIIYYYFGIFLTQNYLRAIGLH